MTIEQKRYFRISLLVFATLAMMIGSYQFLKDKNSYKNTYPLYLKIDDARQIHPSSLVFFNEKKIGIIQHIELLDHSTGLMLTLAVDDGVQIPKTARVALSSEEGKPRINIFAEKKEGFFYMKKDTLKRQE